MNHHFQTLFKPYFYISSSWASLDWSGKSTGNHRFYRGKSRGLPDDVPTDPMMHRAPEGRTMASFTRTAPGPSEPKPCPCRSEKDRRFSSMGKPPNEWLTMENPSIKWMIWGYPHFRKPPKVIHQSPASHPFWICCVPSYHPQFPDFLVLNRMNFIVFSGWFGTKICYFPRNIGLLIIPIDEVIFFRTGWPNHQPVIFLLCSSIFWDVQRERERYF